MSVCIPVPNSSRTAFVIACLAKMDHTIKFYRFFRWFFGTGLSCFEHLEVFRCGQVGTIWRISCLSCRNAKNIFEDRRSFVFHAFLCVPLYTTDKPMYPSEWYVCKRDTNLWFNRTGQILWIYGVTGLGPSIGKEDFFLIWLVYIFIRLYSRLGYVSE